MSEPKIVKAEIGPMPKSLFNPMPTVTATFDNGTSKKLFSEEGKATNANPEVPVRIG